jgi:hypothetical protein
LSSLSKSPLAAVFASVRSTVPSWSGSRLASTEAANEGEAFITAIAGRETASKDAAVKVFTVISFITILLDEITGRGIANAEALAFSRRASQ